MTGEQRERCVRTWGAALLALFSVLAAYVKWGKLDSLLWQDPAWWLNEYGRYARGELPYRDFYWPYGPLSADLFAWPMRIFGARFAVVQTVLDLISATIVFLVYRIADRLMPAPLPAFTATLLVAIGITVRTYFSLFSMIGYTPAVHVAAAGLLLMMWAVIAYVDDGRLRLIWISLGALIACLGKQETLFAAIFVFGALALFDRPAKAPTKAWFARYIILGLSCFLPALLVYAAWGEISGWRKFLACFKGFGLANLACPWWPNGYGVAGALVELVKAALILLLGFLFVPRRRTSFAGRYMLVAAAGLGGMLAILGFEWRIFSDMLTGHGTPAQRIQRDAAELLSTSSFLRPVLWSGYVYAAVILLRAFRMRSFTKRAFTDFLLVAVPGLMSLRSLFGTLGTHDLEVPAITYPFLLLAGPYLLYSALAPSGEPHSRESRFDWYAGLFTSAILAGYGLIRLMGGYAPLPSNATFVTVNTPAGYIGLKMSETERPILDYVLANTAPSDTILELPFGGGMSFATGRRQPTYSTLFIQLRPSEAIQAEDLRRLKAQPPAAVIAREGPHLGTLFGVEGDIGCVFPRLMWKGDKPSSDPAYVFPIVNYIERNYRVEKRIGMWVILRPKKTVEVTSSRN
jgi:hypothetical protein